MARLFGIAGVQMAVVPWDAEATVNRMGELVTGITRNFPWVQLVLFHELVVPGLAQYVPTNKPKDWDRNAQTIPGALTEQLCELARRSRRWLVPGSMWERDGDAVYNTALVISPQGEVVTKYRKMFPWYPYENGTAAGRDFCVFDIPDVGRIGLCICYDQWFPEVARTLAWMGAEVILHPTMTPTSDRPLELVLSQANALFNQCYFISVNGIGPYGGGKSIFVDPDGRVLQVGTETPMVMTEVLDLDHVKRTREYGTIGLSQLLKQFRDSDQKFPIYEQGAPQGEGFSKLGALKFHQTLE